MHLAVLFVALECVIVAGESWTSGSAGRNRVAAVQRAILNKLGLENAPSVNVPQLTQAQRERIKQMFHEKTNRFYEPDDSDKTQRLQSFQSSCVVSDIPAEHSERMPLRFDISETDWQNRRITSAKLSLHKMQLQSGEGIISGPGCPCRENPDVEAQLGDKLRVNVYQYTIGNPNEYQKKLVDSSVLSVNTPERWINVNLKSAVREWIADNSTNFGIEVTVEDNLFNILNTSHVFDSHKCQESTLPVPSHTQPTLDIITVSRPPTATREKRSAVGIDECHSEDIYVNFRDIGWDTWIVAPSGFRTKQCKGSCKNKFPPPLMPLAGAYKCQAASRTSVSVLYIDSESGNVVLREMDDLIVDRCDCLMYGRK